MDWRNAITALLACSLATPALATQFPAQVPYALAEFAKRDLTMKHFDHAAIDLNGDDIPEHVLLADEPRFCGTGGCTLFVIATAPHGFEQIGRAPAVQGPIRLSPQDHDGWQDLLFVARYDATTHYHGWMQFSDGAYRKIVSDITIDWSEPLGADVLIER